MSTMDGLCPWGYEEEEQEHMRLCVISRGLGDIDPTLDPSYVDPTGQATYTPPKAWNRNLGVPIIGGTPYQTTTGRQVFLSSQSGIAPPADYSWLIYAALGIGALMLFSKGRR